MWRSVTSVRLRLPGRGERSRGRSASPSVPASGAIAVGSTVQASCSSAARARLLVGNAVQERARVFQRVGARPRRGLDRCQHHSVARASHSSSVTPPAWSTRGQAEGEKRARAAGHLGRPPGRVGIGLEAGQRERDAAVGVGDPSDPGPGGRGHLVVESSRLLRASRARRGWGRAGCRARADRARARGRSRRPGSGSR